MTRPRYPSDNPGTRRTFTTTLHPELADQLHAFMRAENLPTEQEAVRMILAMQFALNAKDAVVDQRARQAYADVRRFTLQEVEDSLNEIRKKIHQMMLTGQGAAT